MPIPSNWHIKVELKLAALAQENSVMTYLDMVTYADIPSPHRIHQLAEFLEDLIKIDITLGQPIRAARIVSKTNHLPADGFFEYLARHGYVPSAGETRGDFHQRLLLEQGLAQNAN